MDQIAPGVGAVAAGDANVHADVRDADNRWVDVRGVGVRVNFCDVDVHVNFCDVGVRLNVCAVDVRLNFCDVDVREDIRCVDVRDVNADEVDGDRNILLGSDGPAGTVVQPYLEAHIASRMLGYTVVGYKGLGEVGYVMGRTETA